MSVKNTTYHEQKKTGYTLQLRQLLTELPPYASFWIILKDRGFWLLCSQPREKKILYFSPYRRSGLVSMLSETFMSLSR